MKRQKSKLHIATNSFTHITIFRQYYTPKKIQSYIKNWRAVHRRPMYDSAVNETNLKTMVTKYKGFTSNYRYILKIPNIGAYESAKRTALTHNNGEKIGICYNEALGSPLLFGKNSENTIFILYLKEVRASPLLYATTARTKFSVHIGKNISTRRCCMK